ncbi:peroxidase family protein [Blastopirellula marina]|uniref:Peroxidase n=1 Tax=Blastopirellula marina TaxID=124 RepID=A0A2S8FHL5_9BACT|nr:peroxidase family protein [Blastopirellula marina]PQO31645.1 peroxidase [Blastopirellula marina]PTL42952.1 peroxidase [Blastopirellula marina]
MKRLIMKRSHRARRAKISPLMEMLEERQLLASDLLFASIDAEPIANDSAAQPRSRGQAAPLIIPTPSDEYRSIDGTGNNLENPELGSTGEALLRTAPADYADGISTLAGEDRPSAREISNAFSAQDEGASGNERNLSAFVYVWGQFLDHDIDLSESGTTELAPIEVPTGDPYFDPTSSGSATIPLFRSLYDPATGDSVANPREQINAITAYIDGSQVYGSNQATSDALRAFVGGRMLTSEGDLLPIGDDGFFMAGDVRANENAELTSLQTLFVREHNWWADQIAASDPSLSDEEIYQQARAIVIAEIQAITFNEFLPAVLGEGVIPAYTGYNSSVNPNIANEFSTAGYRLGHSLLNDDIEFFGNDGRAVRDEVELAEAFFNPSIVMEAGIDNMLKYAASSQSQEIDGNLVDSVRNFLFGEPGDGGLDLASLNIQRGRDHGLADYNTVRESYGLERVTSFAEITSDVEVQQTLEALYGTVDNIDLWVGALAEDHVPGGSVGELTQAILVDQFTRLRDGDRFWYENQFSAEDAERLGKSSLSDIIQRNTTVTNLQHNVFFMSATVSGTVFADPNQPGGQQSSRPAGLAGVTVNLLNDEGLIIATTSTDAQGNYRFDQFHETGDYQVQAMMPTANGEVPHTIDMLISVGGQSIRHVDFGQPPRNDRPHDGPNDRPEDRRRDRNQDRDHILANDILPDPMDEVIDQVASDQNAGNRLPVRR